MKGDKLPKKFWMKGKSKFFYPRMKEEGIEVGKGWTGEDISKHFERTPIVQLYKKYGFTRKLNK